MKTLKISLVVSAVFILLVLLSSRDARTSANTTRDAGATCLQKICVRDNGQPVDTCKVIVFRKSDNAPIDTCITSAPTGCCTVELDTGVVYLATAVCAPPGTRAKQFTACVDSVIVSW